MIPVRIAPVDVPPLLDAILWIDAVKKQFEETVELIANSLKILPDQNSMEVPNDKTRNIGVIISLLPLDKTLVEMYDLSQSVGLNILEITPNGLAAKAGLNAGDIILAIDDINLQRPQHLVDFLQRKQDGDESIVTFIRGDKIRQAKLNL